MTKEEESQKTYSFMEIIPGLKEGKKYKRKTWEVRFLKIFNNFIFDYNYDIPMGIRYMPYLDDYEANDWIEVK